MKLATAVAIGVSLPGAVAWGGFGHVTVAYVATALVSPDTTAFLQDVLHNKTSDYLAGVATWADTIRYTKWGKFSETFHFIDAKDHPPTSCDVDLERDCKASGCVVTALANYTAQLLDGSLPPNRREQAAKFVVHFVGDIHQPLHNEDVLRGGNGIKVAWGGKELNLHHVWDSSIAEKLYHVRGRYYADAQKTALDLVEEITNGKFKAAAAEWTAGMNFSDHTATGLYWARESNAYVCSHVLPDGVANIVGQELGGDYYIKAAPVIEIQLARAGYRLAKWLDWIAEESAESVGEL